MAIDLSVCGHKFMTRLGRRIQKYIEKTTRDACLAVSLVTEAVKLSRDRLAKCTLRKVRPTRVLVKFSDRRKELK